jgi:imidazole glycerol-phosphate synthase subunit HisH
MIGVVDYGVANVGSISNMLRKLKAEFVVVTSPDQLFNCQGLILPGVGSFDLGMLALEESGLADGIKNFVENEKKMLIGICLGMQLLTDGSEEGELSGFGYLDGKCKRFDTKAEALKVPNIGWNFVRPELVNEYIDGEEHERFYFSHAYYLPLETRNLLLGSADYGVRYSAAVKNGNVVGVQFHPEKSLRFGLKVLGAFVKNVCP